MATDMDTNDQIRRLEEQIIVYERILHDLKASLETLRQEPRLEQRETNEVDEGTKINVIEDVHVDTVSKAKEVKKPLLSSQSMRRWPLEDHEYRRYGRQLIMPEVGLKGQTLLRKTSILIVGVGGLGCPAAAYLAGAGVGHIGLIDGDTVEESNLHRQILHSTSRIGMSKVESALTYLKDLNPLIKYTAYEERLTPERALDIFKEFDVVLDCTDMPTSRYLISDACVLLSKPLVSASALKTEGQLMVLNYPPKPPGDATGGPCYRCVFAKPPPAETVVTCGEGGILGPVVGVMGVLQALEAIKIVTSGDLHDMNGEVSSDASIHPESSKRSHSLLLFSAYSNPQFRTIRLRGRKPACAACSAQSSISASALSSGSLDYVQFCGQSVPVNILPAEQRVTASEAARDREHSLVLDVREAVEFDLCHIQGSVNIPFSQFPKGTDHESEYHQRRSKEVRGALSSILKAQQPKRLNVVCRQGNDSQVVVQLVKTLGIDEISTGGIKDIEGGLVAWRKEVDPDFPVY